MKDQERTASHSTSTQTARSTLEPTNLAGARCPSQTDGPGVAARVRPSTTGPARSGCVERPRSTTTPAQFDGSPCHTQATFRSLEQMNRVEEFLVDSWA